MVDLGPFKESMGRYMGYLVLLGGTILAVKQMFRKLYSWLKSRR